MTASACICKIPDATAGSPSRQDRKGEKARVNPFGEGFWVCALGASDDFSDRKDGVPYEDARKLLDDSSPSAEENSALLLSRVHRWLLVTEARLRERLSPFSVRFPRRNKRFVLLILLSLGVNE